MLINTTEICGGSTDTIRQQQQFWIIILYLVISLFMGVSWRIHSILRVLILIFAQAGFSFVRIRLNDKAMNLGLIWMVQIMLMVTLETSIYLNVRAGARFFLKIKTIEQ